MALPKPPYEHQEYPKWVTGADGKQAVVQDQAEEARFLAEHDKGAKKGPAKKADTESGSSNALTGASGKDAGDAASDGGK